MKYRDLESIAMILNEDAALHGYPPDTGLIIKLNPSSMSELQKDIDEVFPVKDTMYFANPNYKKIPVGSYSSMEIQHTKIHLKLI